MFATHTQEELQAVIDRIEAAGRGLTVGERFLRVRTGAMTRAAVPTIRLKRLAIRILRDEHATLTTVFPQAASGAKWLTCRLREPAAPNPPTSIAEATLGHCAGLPKLRQV